MFGVTVRTNFNNLRQSHIDTPKPAYQPQGELLEPTVVANQLTELKYNAELSSPRIQTKGKTLYVSGEQTKYCDTREGVDRANRIIMNNLLACIIALQYATGDHPHRCRQSAPAIRSAISSRCNRRAKNPVDAGNTEQGFFKLNSQGAPELQPVAGPENFLYVPAWRDRQCRLLAG